MRYIPHTNEDVEQMLGVVGAAAVDELFDIIPERLRFRGAFGLPPPLSEAELMEHLAELGSRNRPALRAGGRLVFCGAGLYRHSIPAAVDALAARSEFYTAYTPYQPELSQGTLLAIFEFQTIVAELLGMEVANASMYDGASAAAEAALMARRITERSRVLLASTLHPEYRDTCRTYFSGLDPEGEILVEVPCQATGAVDLEALGALLDETVAAVMVQTPNFFGVLEDLEPVAQAAHRAGALLVAVCPEPLALALTRAPGDAGADIAVGEGIGLAGPPSLGGPGLGLLAARGKKAVRTMPGRLVGQTTDGAGRTGYVLTLSTREQHIRRERATSNICTNQGLMALRFTIHLSLLGKVGFERLARLVLAKTDFARRTLSAIEGLRLKLEAPVFNELAFEVAGGDAEAVVQRANARGLVPGVAMGRFDPAQLGTLLVSINETHRREDIELLAATLREELRG